MGSCFGRQQYASENCIESVMMTLNFKDLSYETISFLLLGEENMKKSRREKLPYIPSSSLILRSKYDTVSENYFMNTTVDSKEMIDLEKSLINTIYINSLNDENSLISRKVLLSILPFLKKNFHDEKVEIYLYLNYQLHDPMKLSTLIIKDTVKQYINYILNTISDAFIWALQKENNLRVKLIKEILYNKTKFSNELIEDFIVNELHINEVKTLEDLRLLLKKERYFFDLLEFRHYYLKYFEENEDPFNHQ